MSDKIIALQHDGVWFYWLPDGRGWPGKTVRWTAAAESAVEELVPHELKRWWVGSFEATTLTSVSPQPPRTVGYRLKNPATISERFPAELSPEQWSTLDDREVHWSLYDSITEPTEDLSTVYEGPWLRADGPLPPADGRPWTATLPYDLTHHSELRHLFPGHLGGFREALKAALKQIPGVTNVFTNGAFSVYAEVPYEPDRTRWQGAVLRGGGQSKTRGRQVQERMTRSREFYVDDRIAGSDRADAVLRWDEAIARWVALVTEMATARPCGACNGIGLAPWKAEK